MSNVLITSGGPTYPKYHLEVLPSVPGSRGKRGSTKGGQNCEVLLCVWQAQAPLGVSYNHSHIGPQC